MVAPTHRHSRPTNLTTPCYFNRISKGIVWQLQHELVRPLCTVSRRVSRKESFDHRNRQTSSGSCTGSCSTTNRGSVPEFNPRTVGEIAQILTRYISKHAESLGYVDIVSNEFVNFFIQRPQAHAVVPIVEPEAQNTTPEDYLWEMPSGEVLDMLLEQYLESTLLHFLYQSLLAEQAARFLSMDNSTRNAQTLLEDTQLQYNKLRQAIITKELTELAASFQPY